MVMSAKLARYAKFVLAIVVLWVISIHGPSLFFRLSLSLDEQVPLAPSLGSHHDLDYSHDPPRIEQESESKPKAEHHYRDDGLVEVNPEASHPIFELIQKAEKEWEEKKQQASTSLDEAIREYRRRYGRYPPKGFDKWWDYVKLHDVQLPDEYDRIHHDIEHFWGMTPSDLAEIVKGLESEKDSYTIANPKNLVSIVAHAFEDGRYDQLIFGAEGVVDLLSEIEKELPPFRINFTPHDNPNRLTDYEVKDTLLAAAGVGERLNLNDLPSPSSLGWLSSCSPMSRARTLPDMFIQPHNQHIRVEAPVPPSVDSPKFPYESSASRYPSFPPETPRSKTFIYNHPKTMDPCAHPALFWTHGLFVSHNTGPAPQPYMVPQFSACTTEIHHNINFPTSYGWIEDLPPSENPPWEDREDERLMWRGSDTGIWHGNGVKWGSNHRDWLIRWATGVHGVVDVLFDSAVNETSQVGVPKQMRKALLNPSMVDMGFAGEMQCEPEVCRKMEEIYPETRRMSREEAGNYKYVMDLDGNGWSGRFKRLITSNALVFKSTVFPEWYTARIQPWVHYVPVQVDLSDLYDSLIFFRGDPNGEGAHEELAKKIATEGREWSRTFWRREDLIAYFYRLILEYVRVMSPGREEMNYEGGSNES
ncbi:hypothetical protein E1B28_008384 [Marasmius oreades]|uniref:Glycosyl transferase CAP10 domain-containing protein n=1 Tax=Marasmius oreades TaxID=181124 RepID=A0A9P7URQ0_9AGAR|nr:uncharacterized protein E1B28_008384 [Marasmius oreades]KAG7091997.1 hypothetical protein E1B28_008384 [Marasmius oreades]